MGLMGGIFLAVVVYFVMLYMSIKITVDKLGARSGLFGAGLATMFTGFIWHELLEISLINEWIWY